MLGGDEQMQPEFVDFPNFAQGFTFARRETGQEILENPLGGISPGLCHISQICKISSPIYGILITELTHRSLGFVFGKPNLEPNLFARNQ